MNGNNVDFGHSRTAIMPSARRLGHARVWRRLGAHQCGHPGEPLLQRRRRRPSRRRAGRFTKEGHSANARWAAPVRGRYALSGKSHQLQVRTQAAELLLRERRQEKIGNGKIEGHGCFRAVTRREHRRLSAYVHHSRGCYNPNRDTTSRRYSLEEIQVKLHYRKGFRAWLTTRAVSLLRRGSSSRRRRP